MGEIGLFVNTAWICYLLAAAIEYPNCNFQIYDVPTVDWAPKVNSKQIATCEYISSRGIRYSTPPKKFIYHVLNVYISKNWSAKMKCIIELQKSILMVFFCEN